MGVYAKISQKTCLLLQEKAFFKFFSVVEKADSCEGHSDIVLIAGLDDIVITYRAACLGDIAYAALVCALDIVTEGEEGIGAKAYTLGLFEPFLLFLTGEYRGLLGEYPLPFAVPEKVLVFLTDVHINRIVAVRTADV